MSAPASRPHLLQKLGRAFRALGAQPRYAIKTVGYGLVGAASAIALALAIEFLFSRTIEHFSHLAFWEFALYSLGSILATSALVGYLLSVYAPDAAGSGVPQLKLAYWERFGYVRWRETWVKFVACILSVGGGTSLGREGPSVFVAGAMSGHFARWMGETRKGLRPAAAAGAAAGLAAAFNTPIAAIFFVLEEMLEDLNSRHLGGVILASVTGAFTVWAVIGSQPAFQLRELADPNWQAYVLIPLVAALASLVGVGFQRASLYLRWKRRTRPLMPAWLYPVAAGLMTWVLGVSVFYLTGKLGVFGLGYHDMSEALGNHEQLTLVGGRVALFTIVALLVAKFAATVLAYGFGGCGGIFAPTLFFGTMTGLLVAYIAELILPNHSLGGGEETVLAVVGMSACLGAVVRAPITSILIVFEMTHQFSIVPALMVGAIISQAISRYFNEDNFYSEVLKQDGADLDLLMPPRDLGSWLSMPVGEHVRFQRFILRSLDPEATRAAIATHQVAWFPVVIDDALEGVVSRFEIERALEHGQRPNVAPAMVASPYDTIGHVQSLLLDSTSDAVVIRREKDGKVLGIVTMRALLTEEIAHSAQRY
ncbi:MAG: chloride channel protein [Verrucomicrobiota bacterium]